MPEYLTRSQEDAIGTPTDERRIDVRLVRYGEVANHTLEGIKETFARGAFDGIDPAGVILEAQRHDGAITGVAERIWEDDSAAYATFRVAATPSGDELLTLAREGVLRNASVVFASKKHRNLPGGVIERQSVDLARVAILPRGAYPSAQVLAVREEAKEDIVNDVVTQTMDLSPVTAAIESVERRLGAIETMGGQPAAAEPEAFKFRSLGEYARAAYNSPSAYMSRPGDGQDLLARTIADQITTNNAGVITPGYIKDVKRIVNLGRRAINAFGGPKSLPEKGLSVQWPFLTSSNTLIATQSTQKTEFQSARVDIDAATASIVTYAGGSDISYQLLERSDPSYYDAYQRIMVNAWATVTDNAFVTAIEGASGTTTKAARGVLGADVSLSTSAASDDIIDATSHGFSIGDAVVFTALTGGTGLTAGRVYWVTSTSYAASTFRVTDTPGGAAIGFTADITAGTVAKVTDTGPKFRTSLFEASVAVETATGSPASIVLASTDVFLALASLTNIVSPVPAGNPSNADGTALASTLRMDASGLEIVHHRGVTAGKFVVSNSMAAAWLEDGPKWVTAEDVHLLGRDVAVYSFAAPAVYVPAAIVEVTLI